MLFVEQMYVARIVPTVTYLKPRATSNEARKVTHCESFAWAQSVRTTETI